MTIIAVLVALVATRCAERGAPPGTAARAVMRNVVGGAIAMDVTYGIGTLIGAAGIQPPGCGAGAGRA